MAEVRALIISLVLFSAIIIGMTSFYGELTRPEYLAAYGLNSTQIDAINPDNLASENVTNLITEKVEGIEDALRSRPTGISTVDVAWGYINAGLSAVTLPLDAIAYFQNIITDSFQIIGIPGWFGTIIIVIITIIIVFNVLSAYMKWRI